jgi:hypothetical protein
VSHHLEIQSREISGHGYSNHRGPGISAIKSQITKDLEAYSIRVKNDEGLLEKRIVKP